MTPADCPRCGGVLLVEEPGTLSCLPCGERLYDRHLLFAERLADAVNELTVRDVARELVHTDPELAERPRWDARRAPEAYQVRAQAAPAARQVAFRVTAAEYAELGKQAEDRGQTISALVRTVLRVYLASSSSP